MAGFYHDFTTARLTEPDARALLDALHQGDVTAGVQHLAGTPTYTIKKATDWTAPQKTFVQNAIDTAPAASAALDLQHEAERLLDSERLASAIVWAILQQIAPPATPAKYVVARDRIVAAYQTQPWKG